MFRKHFSKIKGWMYYHRILTIGFVTVLILHIYDVGIQTPNLLIEALNGSQNQAYAQATIADNTSTNNKTATSNVMGSTNNDTLSNSDAASSSDISSSNDASSSSDISSSSDVSSSSDIFLNNDISSSSDTSSSSDASNSNGTSIDSINKQMSGVVLNDGVYEGVATGYGDGLTVSVTIKTNAITNIEIVSHNERNSRFYAPAMEQVPAEILDSQSLDVDTVSGSTFTSIGIINAVKDALSQALVSGALPDDLSLPSGKGHH